MKKAERCSKPPPPIALANYGGRPLQGPSLLAGILPHPRTLGIRGHVAHGAGQTMLAMKPTSSATKPTANLAQNEQGLLSVVPTSGVFGRRGGVAPVAPSLAPILPATTAGSRSREDVTGTIGSYKNMLSV